MRHNALARATLAAAAAVAVSVPIAGVAQAAQAAQAAPMHGQVKSIQRPIRRHHNYLSFNQLAAAYAKTLEGIPYVWGGTSKSGFDCSGLTQYVYRHFGKQIQRTADDQFREFAMISHVRARPGDLVFFHDTSDPSSYVYHVGVYEGGEYMVAATHTGGTVEWQSFAWAGDTVTFGTISH
jgi:cell wall-associated NlpC family hydrolase